MCQRLTRCSLICFPFPPVHVVRLYFPVFLAVRSGHVTEFWSLKCVLPPHLARDIFPGMSFHTLMFSAGLRQMGTVNLEATFWRWRSQNIKNPGSLFEGGCPLDRNTCFGLYLNEKQISLVHEPLYTTAGITLTNTQCTSHVQLGTPAVMPFYHCRCCFHKLILVPFPPFLLQILDHITLF